MATWLVAGLIARKLLLQQHHLVKAELQALKILVDKLEIE